MATGEALIRCLVCGANIGSDGVRCQVCETPHHPDCWTYAGGCAFFGCGGQSPERCLETPPPEEFEPELLIIDETTTNPGRCPRCFRPIFAPLSTCLTCLVALDRFDGTTPRRTAPNLSPYGVLVISWLYMAVSLFFVVPAFAFFCLTLCGEMSTLNGMMFVLFAAAASVTKRLGDGLAVGDRWAARLHLVGMAVACAVCLMENPLISVGVAFLIIPFCTPAAIHHFSADGRRA